MGNGQVLNLQLSSGYVSTELDMQLRLNCSRVTWKFVTDPAVVLNNFQWENIVLIECQLCASHHARYRGGY